MKKDKAFKIKIGNLNKFITFQEPIRSAGGMSKSIATYTNITALTNIPAAIWAKKATEEDEQQQTKHVVIHHIQMRWHPNITTDFRIVYDSRTFEIKSMINYREMNVRLDFECEEKT